MKQKSNTNKDTMKTMNQKADNTMKKHGAANACHKTNMNWGRIEKTRRYRSASAKEAYEVTTKKIETEVLDGIFLNLNSKSQSQSTKVQNRILRRIVEKRQAQANHKKNGRTEDLTSIRFSIVGTRRCMETIRKKRFAA